MEYWDLYYSDGDTAREAKQTEIGQFLRLRDSREMCCRTLAQSTLYRLCKILNFQ